jgi:hypothetical protein
VTAWNVACSLDRMNPSNETPNKPLSPEPLPDLDDEVEPETEREVPEDAKPITAGAFLPSTW